jgi:hypothetical protein
MRIFLFGAFLACVLVGCSVNSGSADKEACLVRASPDGFAVYRSNDVHGGSIPLVVLKLLRDFGVHDAPNRVFHRQTSGPYGQPRYESIFVHSDITLAPTRKGEAPLLAAQRGR